MWLTTHSGPPISMVLLYHNTMENVFLLTGMFLFSPLIFQIRRRTWLEREAPFKTTDFLAPMKLKHFLGSPAVWKMQKIGKWMSFRIRYVRHRFSLKGFNFPTVYWNSNGMKDCWVGVKTPHTTAIFTCLLKIISSFIAMTLM